VEEGELLVTSGLAGIFPKGLPVARVTSVSQSDISLFQAIKAELLVDPSNLEELLLLINPMPQVAPGGEPDMPVDSPVEGGPAAVGNQTAG